VTPTSQIVGTQAVLNVLSGEPYQTISRETAGVLRGEYGATPAPVNAELQARVLEGVEPITCRPADRLQPELGALTAELRRLAAEKFIPLTSGEREIDDVLTYALFTQVGLKFLENRGNPAAFEPVPGSEPEPVPAPVVGPEVYTVRVDGRSYVVEVAEGGDISAIAPVAPTLAAPATKPDAAAGEALAAPLAGTIFAVDVAVGDVVSAGDVVVVMEVMKMETEVRATVGGTVTGVAVKAGDMVAVGDTLITIG